MKIHSVDGVDLTGKYALIKKDGIKKEFHGLAHRIVKVTGGFGCKPNALGRAIFTTDLNGVSERWDRSAFEGWVEESEVKFLQFAMNKEPV